MAVLGTNCFVFEWSGKSCSVHPFTSTLGTAQNVPIVDAALTYDCPYIHKTYVLLLRNVLYMPDLHHNLLPPFLMRQGGVTVDEKPKIHCSDPTSTNHSISFPDNDLRIPLQLNGIFSFFYTRDPNNDELVGCDKLFITPDASQWNPYCSSFKLN